MIFERDHKQKETRKTERLAGEQIVEDIHAAIEGVKHSCKMDILIPCAVCDVLIPYAPFQGRERSLCVECSEI